jgi:hypothetical protein
MPVKLAEHARRRLDHQPGRGALAVAVYLVVEREEDLQHFCPGGYWKS